MSFRLPPQVIRRRLDVYNAAAKPVEEFYERQGKVRAALSACQLLSPCLQPACCGVLYLPYLRHPVGKPAALGSPCQPILPPHAAAEL